MKTFHHGGRIGDMVFALWTMKALGGGKLYVSDYHVGNWDLNIARSMESFLRAQPYIHTVEFIKYTNRPKVDYDLQDAEDDHNPEKFPDFDTAGPWPGNANIAQRYAVHFGLTFDHKPWLWAPKKASICDVVFHCPLRRSILGISRWQHIINPIAQLYNVTVVGGEDRGFWINSIPFAFFSYGDLLQTAILINSSKVFVGAVSSCNAIAEGLGIPTIVEQADGCFNVTPTVSINNMSDNEIIKTIMEKL